MDVVTPIKSETLVNPSSLPPAFRVQSYFGFATPPALGRKSSHGNLGDVRRTLSFTKRDIQTVLNAPVKDLDASTIRHSDVPPRDVEDIYYSFYLERLSEFLIPCTPSYFFSLHWSGETTENVPNHQLTARWEITVLVPEPEVEHTKMMLVSQFVHPLQGHLPIRVATGRYEHISSINRSSIDHPTPGASIGLQGVTNNTVSFGGYVRGKKTKKLFAMSVAHFLYEEPQKPEEPTPSILNINYIDQPSSQDYFAQLNLLQEQISSMTDANEQVAAAESKREYEKWRRLDVLRAFALPTFAAWTTQYVDDPVRKTENATQIGEPNTNENENATPESNSEPVARIGEPIDVSISLVNEARVGTNQTNPPEGRGFLKNVRGKGNIKKGVPVYKIGRSTGYTEGLISTETKTVFYDKRQGCRMLSYAVSAARSRGYHFMAEGGDSGSWLINGAGKVVGMIWGAAVEDSTATTVTRPLEAAVFLPIQECLDVCGKAIGEELDVEIQ